MSNRSFIEAIQQLASKPGSDEVFVTRCSVDSVDPSARTCDCTPVNGHGTAQFIGVQLMSDVDDGFFIVPAIGSTVMVAYSKHNPPSVILFSQIDRGIMATMNGFQFEDGTFGGMVKVQELTDKINRLENLLNEFIQLYNSHTHTANDTPAVMLETNTIDPITERADLENTNLTHGN